jgi:hypothetical protein
MMPQVRVVEDLANKARAENAERQLTTSQAQLAALKAEHEKLKERHAKAVAALQELARGKPHTCIDPGAAEHAQSVLSTILP